MADTTTHNKLVVVDINLDWKFDKLNDRRYKDMPLVYDLTNKASQYQTVVVSTSGCLSDALDFAGKINLNKGYIIASSGSIIYDLAQRKIIEMLTIDSDDIQTIIHHGLMNGINIAIYTSNRKFMYVCNNVVYDALKDDCYSHHDVITSYDLLKQTLQRTDIVDIAYLHFLGSVNNSKQDLLLSNLDKYWEQEVCNVAIKLNRTTSYVHFGHKEATKLKAIQRIMSICNVLNQSDVLYIAGSCVNRECYITFRNSLITANSDFINEVGNKMNHKYLAKEVNTLDPEFGLHSNSFWK